MVTWSRNILHAHKNATSTTIEERVSELKVTYFLRFCLFEPTGSLSLDKKLSLIVK